jgi:hypothetical protein
MRALVVLGFAFAVSAGAQATTLQRGTLMGVVTRGPITPVCMVGKPCTEPARNIILLFSRRDRVAGRSITDEHGRYRLRLPAGTYVVAQPGPTTLGRRLAPSRVRVTAARTTQVDFFIDTGIR